VCRANTHLVGYNLRRRAWNRLLTRRQKEQHFGEDRATMALEESESHSDQHTDQHTDQDPCREEGRGRLGDAAAGVVTSEE
jgi:hypothetical protein